MSSAATGARRCGPGNGWEDPRNVVPYARFARDSDWYPALAGDLAARLGTGPIRLAADLCAGTGASTRAILARLPADARVIAADRSAAMLSEARAATADPRVTWVRAAAEDCGSLAPGRADAVLCSAALWETDVPAVLAGVRALLRPGGRFVFNLSPAAVTVGPRPAAAPGRPGLLERMVRYAVAEYGYLPRPPATAVRPWSWPDYQRALAAHGMRAETAETAEYAMTIAQMYQWLSIPMFLPPLPGLTEAQRRHALRMAFDSLDPGQVARARWLVVAAVRPAAGAAALLSNPENTCHD